MHKGNAQVSALPATADWAGGRVGASSEAPKRSFEEIVADAKSNRNILEVNLKKNSTDEVKPLNLSFDQIWRTIV